MHGTPSGPLASLTAAVLVFATTAAVGCGASEPACAYHHEVGTVTVTELPEQMPPTTLEEGVGLPEAQQTRVEFSYPGGHPAQQYGTRRLSLDVPACRGVEGEVPLQVDGEYPFRMSRRTAGTCAAGTMGIALPDDGVECVPYRLPGT